MAYTSWSVVFGEQPSAAKWNILGTNDASFNDGSGIADDAITPEKLTTGAGSSWAWQDWTPTLTNMTLGSGTVTAKYIQIGKTVHLYFEFTLGSGSAMGTNPQFSLPVGAAARYGTHSHTIGSAYIEDFANSALQGVTRLQGSTTTASVRSLGTAGTTANLAQISATSPFTWGSGDYLNTTCTYEAA